MATVTIAGVAGSVHVNPDEGATVADVLEAAARQIGVEIDTTTLSPVVNGADADAGTTVGPEDRVTAAPRVANG